MKPLNDLLGFAVLTGPLWLILILLSLAIWIAVKVAKQFERRNTKIAAGLLMFLLVFFVPFGDEISGRIYLSHLCATEAGAKVYKTVELPAEYWNEHGQARFINRQGYLNHDFWVKRIDEGGGHVEPYSFILSIDKDVSKVADRASHELLGEIITFRYWGGWVRRNIGIIHNTANSCEFIHEPNFGRDFYGRLFKPSHSSK